MRFIDIYVALFLGVASVSDTRTKKVPNKWILLWIAVGICVRGYKFLTAFLFSLIFTYILYKIFRSGGYKDCLGTVRFSGNKGGGIACVYGTVLIGGVCFLLSGFKKNIV